MFRRKQEGDFAVKFFLTFPHFSEERALSGTEDISEDQIRPVEGELICTRLNQLITQNQAYLEMQESSESKGKEKYFYRTDDFYYIFWKQDGFSTGPRTLFLVVSKDFNRVWEFYG